MNKLLVILLCSALLACADTPDLRPEPFLKSEALLQQGLNAYENDDFFEAKERFNQALAFYQSFDNQRGMTLARLNLIETALAMSDFANAQLVLNQLKQQADLGPELKRKLIFLEAKLQTEQQYYSQALATLQPLLETSSNAFQSQEEHLNILALQAKLELLTSPSNPSTGLAKFEKTLTQLESQPLSYQILLKRLWAMDAMNRSDYQSARHLLTAALDYYKKQAQRRSIAACLEELADLERRQKNQTAAKAYLQRALIIRQWLKNDHKSQKIQKLLNSSP